jgi:hypothetical protein
MNHSLRKCIRLCNFAHAVSLIRNLRPDLKGELPQFWALIQL